MKRSRPCILFWFTALYNITSTLCLFTCTSHSQIFFKSNTSMHFVYLLFCSWMQGGFQGHKAEFWLLMGFHGPAGCLFKNCRVPFQHARLHTRAAEQTTWENNGAAQYYGSTKTKDKEKYIYYFYSFYSHVQIPYEMLSLLCN